MGDVDVTDLCRGAPERVDQSGVGESPALDEEIVGPCQHELARPVEEEAVGRVHVTVSPTLKLKTRRDLLKESTFRRAVPGAKA